MAVVGAASEETFTPRYRTIKQAILQRLANLLPGDHHVRVR